jgi:hypothetical protein
MGFLCILAMFALMLVMAAGAVLFLPAVAYGNDWSVPAIVAVFMIVLPFWGWYRLMRWLWYDLLGYHRRWRA